MTDFALQILRKYLFSTDTPSVDDYSQHIRPENANPDGKQVVQEYNMLDFMTTGGGRFAYPLGFVCNSGR